MRIQTSLTDSNPSRRHFIKGTATASLGALAFGRPTHGQASASPLPPPLSALKPLGSLVHPITLTEFAERLEHAQQLMSGAAGTTLSAKVIPDVALHYDALFFAPGSSLYYFTGIRWGLSERLLGLLIPRAGTPIVVVPAFEEGRLREKLRLPFEVRAWQEDESPTKIAAAALA